MYLCMFVCAHVCVYVFVCLCVYVFACARKRGGVECVCVALLLD